MQLTAADGTAINVRCSDNVRLLGFELDRDLKRFSKHNAAAASRARRGLGALRLVASHLGRDRRLLRSFAEGLVITHLRNFAFMTHAAHVLSKPQGPRHGDAGAEHTARVLLHDTARVIIGARRAEHVRVEDLLDTAKIPTLNEIVVTQAAMAAADDVHTGVYGGVLTPPSSSSTRHTRAMTADLRFALDPGFLAAINMAMVWNASTALRSATTRFSARSVARRLGREYRHVHH